jgi:type IV fimbrial biogenesis protein FimT
MRLQVHSNNSKPGPFPARGEGGKSCGEQGQQGFGLIEQIVALVVLAILAAVAIPSFRGLIGRHEMRVAQTDYIAALQHAHDLAVNDQVRTLFCPSSDALTCNNDSNWGRGWLIGRDPQNNGQPDGAPLYVGGKYSDRLNIVGGSKKSVRFQPDGTASGSNQTLTICVKGDDTRALKVVVASRGRIRGEVANTEDAAKCAASS